MTKLVLDSFVNLQNETSVVNKLNSNNAAVIVAVENTLSRDGTQPNAMEADLDMNDNRILNLPEPVQATEPLRLGDAEPFLDQIIEARDATLAALDDFTDIYLGRHSASPTFDNDGDPLVIGALYYNDVDDKFYVYGIDGWESTDADAAAEAAAAAASAAAAAISADEANDKLDEFRDVYLGSFAAEPTQDLEGGPLDSGDMYFNEVSNHLYIWDAIDLAWFSSAGITDVVQDISPQLGGDLDLNGSDITGSGNIDITGNADITGNVTVSGTVEVADEAYGPTWNTSLEVPTKNAIYDEIEAIVGTDLPATYQPLDTELTSWSGVTRAAGFDTFVTTPSSANLASLVTNEDGTGLLVFDTAPSISDIDLTGVTDVQQSTQFTGDITPTILSADAHDWTPTGLATATVIRASANTPVDLTGITGGADGRILFIHNVGAETISIRDEDLASTALNRFAIPADLAVTENMCVLLQYDATSQRWRIIGGGSTGGGASVTVSDTEPGTPANGDQWFDTTVGVLYIYIDDGDTEQWIETGPGVIGGYAPDDASYIVQAVHGELSGERALTDTSSITWDFGTASQAKANVAVGYAPDVIIEDQKAQNTSGGTFTNGADRTRDLNTLVRNAGTLASLSSNQFTLPAGTYYIRWSAPCYNTDRHQSFLYNVTDATEVKRGTSDISGNGSNGFSHSLGSTVVTIAASKAFEIRHRCNTTVATFGFGVAGNFGTEVYTRVEIMKVA